MGKVLRSEVVFPTLTLGESEAEKSCNLADWQINGSEAVGVPSFSSFL